MTFRLHVDSFGSLVSGATFVPPSFIFQNQRRPKDAEEFFEWVEVGAEHVGFDRSSKMT